MPAKAKKTPPQSTSPDDPATAYAKDVTAGKIVAGPHVRSACKRHLDDLKHGAKRGLKWDVDAANTVIMFFEDMLTIEREDEAGNSFSAAFYLEPWQTFIIGSLFGWKNKAGLRRFRRAYVETAKGNGKTPMAAGIGHYMLSYDKKLRAEVYSAATVQDQAMILFRDAVAMCERSPSLRKRLVTTGGIHVHQLTDLKSGSFFKATSSEKKGKSGIRPHCALIDEVHEHRDNTVIEILRAGTKQNQQALIFEITNAGFDRSTVCWAEHEYTIKVVDRGVENDAWFGFICGLDEGDLPFEDEACWIKANPNLGVSIRLPYIREQLEEARGMPSKESYVRRLHFCEWVDAAETWIRQSVWQSCEAVLDIKNYVGEACFCGLDLAFTKDMSALALAFPTGVDTYDCFVEFWKPKIGLQDAMKSDGVAYDMWVRKGFLNLTEGKVIKLEPIARRMAEIAALYDLQTVAYDNYRHRELADDMADMGIVIPMTEHPQGFRRAPDNPLWMPNSVEELENAIQEGRIRVSFNLALRWNVACTVIRPNPRGTDDKIFNKLKSTGRIDGVVALAMAVGAAKRYEDKDNGPSCYETGEFYV